MPRDQQRLTMPLVRTEAGLQPAGWDEALATAAEGFGRIRDLYGGAGYASFSCSKATNEMNFMAQKFARAVMGSNNIDSCNRT